MATRAEFEALLKQRDMLVKARRSLLEKKQALMAQVRKNPLALYRPTKPEECEYGDSQWQLHLSVAKERLAYGGNRSGKTESGAAEVAMHASGFYPEWYPREGRIRDGEIQRRNITIRCYATNFKNGINEIMWPKILKYLPKDLHVEPVRGTKAEVESAFLPNGVRLLFGTYGQRDESERGTEADFVWFDEPPDSEDRYLEIVRGTLDRGGRILLTMTPLDCEWLEQSILSQATQDPTKKYKPFVVYLDIRDNPYVPQEEKDWWVSRLPEAQRFTRVMGRPKGLLSTVFGEYDGDIHLIPPFPLPMKDGHPDGWNLFQTVDPHDAYPPATVWWVLFDPKLGGGISKIFAIREAFGPDMVIQAAVAAMRNVEGELGARPRGRIMDPNFGNKKTSVTGQTIQEEYHKASRALKYPMTFRLGVDNQAVGHDAIRQLLVRTMPAGPWEGRPQLQIFDICNRLALAFRFYRRKEPGSEKVIDNEHKHWMDNARYFATSRFRYVNEWGDGSMKNLTMIEKIIMEERKAALEPPPGGGRGVPLFGEEVESSLTHRF